MKTTTGRIVFYLFLGGLPLLIYPPFFVASIMSLAAATGNEPFVLALFAKAIFSAVIAYPAVYVACLLCTVVQLLRIRRQSGEEKAVAGRRGVYFSSAPLVYLLVLVALLVVLACVPIVVIALGEYWRYVVKTLSW